MPCRRSRRPASLQRRLMQTLLLRLGVGLAIAAVGTFIAVHTVLTSRLDSQLDGTAQLVDQYAQQTPPGTKFDFAAGIGSAPSPGTGASAAPGSASGTGTDG